MKKRESKALQKDTIRTIQFVQEQLNYELEELNKQLKDTKISKKELRKELNLYE